MTSEFGEKNDGRKLVENWYGKPFKRKFERDIEKNEKSQRENE